MYEDDLCAALDLVMKSSSGLLTPSLRSFTKSSIDTSRAFNLLFIHFVKVFCWTVIHDFSRTTIASLSMVSAYKNRVLEMRENDEKTIRRSRQFKPEGRLWRLDFLKLEKMES